MNKVLVLILTLLILSLLVLTVSCGKKENPLNGEAERQATAWWNNYLSKCGKDSYIYTGRGETLYQLREISILTFETPRAYTEADRLNQKVNDWEGKTVVIPSVYRVRHSYESYWRDWHDGWPSSPDISGPLFEVTFQKNRGEWLFDEDRFKPAKPDCSKIPPED